MTEEQIAIIKALQEGIAICEEPFDEAAKKAGVSAERVIEQIRMWCEDGVIRRFGAIIRHRRAGFVANAMAVWDVPDDCIETFADAAASHQEVSHCYQRPRFEGFPYNIYTMIHGRKKEDCEHIANEISEKTGITNFRLLYTAAEHKKTSPLYFLHTQSMEGGE